MTKAEFISEFNSFFAICDPLDPNEINSDLADRAVIFAEKLGVKFDLLPPKTSELPQS